MLETLRRLWKKAPKPVDLAPMKVWADSRGLALRQIRHSDGCLVEPMGTHPLWRIEWGASQRSYIVGRELRIIGEVGTPKALMALLLTRPLMQAMEKLVFEQYVADVQTRLDIETPAEMRWLVLYTKLTGTELGRLRERYAAVCSVKQWITQWLAGALNEALAETLQATDADVPMVLMIARGRLTLRTPMPQVDDKLMAMWLTVFEHAQREASRVGREWNESPEANQLTQSAARPRSVLPGDEQA